VAPPLFAAPVWGYAPDMGWGFVWLMLVLKIPIAMLLYIVWWAVKQTDEEPTSGSSGDGGSKVPPHPHGPFPRPPRRGPHGDPAPSSPPRVRTVEAKAREHQP
jgi:hypothetical protein